jgi:hypothetical protein
MADLSDVTTYLAGVVANAVYPGGISQPSIAPVYPGQSNPMDVRVFEGWPDADMLDLDLSGSVLSGSPPVKGPRSNGPCVDVSIFPQSGTTSKTYQILDNTYVITPVSYGMSIALASNVVTITGQPNTGEYLTVVIDRQYIYSETGVSTSAILAALAADISVNYPGTTSTSSTLTISGTTHDIEVRQGGVATMGKVIHRQCHLVMITVWAPTEKARAQIAAAIDNLIKQNIRITLPDTSQAVVMYSRTSVSDEFQNVTVYRRDLFYEVDYATVQQFPGYVVTSFTNKIQGGNWGSPSSPAITNPPIEPALN